MVVEDEEEMAEQMHVSKCVSQLRMNMLWTCLHNYRLDYHQWRLIRKLLSNLIKSYLYAFALLLLLHLGMP